MSTAAFARRLSAGAELQASGGAHVRVWAPACRHVELVIPAGSGAAERALTMEPEPDGFFSAVDREAIAGGRYWFRLDHDRLRPDPASRFQPDGPHGPSQVSTRRRSAGPTAAGRARLADGQVIYEMHVGTFTPEGTWAAAAAQLPELARLGVTVLEVMPVADFPGRFGWGYDGVDLFAPTRLYGAPDDLRRVRRSRRTRSAWRSSSTWSTTTSAPTATTCRSSRRSTSPTGTRTSGATRSTSTGPRPARREFFVANAGYWIDEFHLDGLRLDATQDIRDATPDDHMLAAVAARRARAAGSRPIF